MWVRGKWTSKSAQRWRQAAHWLDRQPLPRVIAAGAVLGLSLGLPGFFYLRSPAWMVFWGVLFVALWCLGRDSEPVYEHDTPISTTPKRVEDGPFTMMQLPGGDFYMGSPDNDNMANYNEIPQHPVTVLGFRMAVTPVTAELYHEIMQGEAPAEGRELTPAVNVSWFHAVEFCNRLSKREGYRRCYYRLFGRWFCYWRADGYRLPTEAEWEYACRAGTKTRYSFGDDPNRLDRYAWFSGNTTQEVAQKLPNPWGSTICTAMSGSGVGIGIVIIRRRKRLTQPVLNQVLIGSCAAAPSSFRPRACAPPPGSSTVPWTGACATAFAASASPG